MISFSRFIVYLFIYYSEDLCPFTIKHSDQNLEAQIYDILAHFKHQQGVYYKVSFLHYSQQSYISLSYSSTKLILYHTFRKQQPIET